MASSRNQVLPTISGNPEDVTVTPALPASKAKLKAKHKRKGFNPELCWCGCRSRKNPKRKYFPGHSAYARYRPSFGVR